MKKDYSISFIVLVITGLFIFIVTREFFLEFASSYKLLGGFVKFFFLASIGDFIGLRIKSGKWQVPNGIIYKMIIWGIIGVVIVLMFDIFTAGVAKLQMNNVLPWGQYDLAFAFFVSLLMNFTFAPTMMTFHRISDTFIERRNEENNDLGSAIDSINFKQFFSFTVLKTIPFFWVPAHTITFLLPAEYRIIFAAILGIFLGLLLGLFKNRK